jgi:hypothetical protein
MTGFEKFSLDSGYWAVFLNALPVGCILSYFWTDLEVSLLGFLILDNHFVAGLVMHRIKFHLRQY